MVKLEQILQYTIETCRISRFTPKFVRNKNAVFMTEIDMLKFEKQQQLKTDKMRIVTYALQVKIKAICGALLNLTLLHGCFSRF